MIHDLAGLCKQISRRQILHHPKDKRNITRKSDMHTRDVTNILDHLEETEEKLCGRGSATKSRLGWARSTTSSSSRRFPPRGTRQGVGRLYEEQVPPTPAVTSPQGRKVLNSAFQRHTPHCKSIQMVIYLRRD